MVDAERLRRILASVEENLATLAAYRGQDRTQLLADERSLGHVKWLFVAALEGCIDAAHHVCASEALAVPNTNADAMRSLVRARVLDGDLGESMARAVGFRNILVHQYADIDDAKVVAHLDNLADVDAFIAAMARLVTE